MKWIEDLVAYSNRSTLKMILTLLLNPNFHCGYIYRTAHLLGKLKLLVPFSKLLMYLNRVLYSVDIDYRAELSGGLQIVHGIGLVIGKDVKSEGPIKIYQGVTLGGSNGKTKTLNGKEFGQPQLGKNIVIYTNSIVVGPCIIGDNVIIGAKTLVTHDIGENMLVTNEFQETIKEIN